MSLEVTQKLLHQHPHQDPVVQDMIISMLRQITAHTSHVQHCVIAMQMRHDQQQRTFCEIAPFDLKNMLLHLAFLHPQITVPMDLPADIFEGSESGLYSILYYASQNAIKHGGGHSITLEVTEDASGTTVTLTNSEGVDQAQMLLLQAERGPSWLLKHSTDTLSLKSDNVGLPGSTYQGCRNIQRMAQYIRASATIMFYTARTVFTLHVPTLRSIKRSEDSEVQPTQDLSKLCVLCADDQNMPRLQVFNAVKSLGLQLKDCDRTQEDITEGLYRNEPNVKMFGRTQSEVAGIEPWRKVVEEWEGQPAIIILDQNLVTPTVTVTGQQCVLQLVMTLNVTLGFRV